ncbi:M48 family metallopeptidase [Xanthobacter dioxanivorans]|uniref:M48 family metallopeptidase n=1 Tax=Xanthobacter dioxanivorans TaxID=2528964 RepID=A0A974PJT5_9HYPH|nr:M48 family metalloprotease [Xanthobacter dioxanivorans]QRG04932.1 M48 family metallopeptidase [Xanthobacter dioxanivorans]
MSFQKLFQVARRGAARLGRGACLLAAVSLPVQVAVAQESSPRGRPTTIRDTEIEALLRDYTRPILKTAGLAQQNVEVVLISERSFNAFVADGRRIFVNTGALVDSVTPNQIIGVLAHETGHIAGGHLARMREQLAGAQTMAIVAMLLAAGGMAAGAASGMNGRDLGNVGAAAMSAPQEAIRRSLLSYQRGEEQAADRSAVKYLDATGQSSKGMIETFERFQSDQLFISQRVDPYLLSHPMARERIAALEELAKKSPYYNVKDPPALQARHDMMRAKLIGFMERPEVVARRYPASDTSMAAQYARAISAYRFGNVSSAVAQIDALIARDPSNPYFYELKGQALLESGRAADAVAPLRKAVSMTGNAPLIRSMLGQALVESGKPSDNSEAMRELVQATQRDPNSSSAWRSLSIAYGRAGDLANADLAAAQGYFATGDFKSGRELAARARQRFPQGSPGWLKADDLVNFKPPKSALNRPQ